MDAGRFVRELPRLFAAYPRSKHPRDRRFAPILADVGGLARENNLALLNLAASLLRPGESYVEVGSFRGLSLIAAMQGNAGDFVAIDDFSLAEGSRKRLEANLGRYGLGGYTILEGDAFTLLQKGVLGNRRVGVYYYDAAHDYQSQVRGLRLIEPYLVEDALLIVDDTDWTEVARAMRDYLAGQPRAERLLTLHGKASGQPWWWEGVQVLRWRARPTTRSRRRSAGGVPPARRAPRPGAGR
jgi:predicted O-methyltransferase YrrM